MASNPVFNENTLGQVGSAQVAGQGMTLTGTINKALALFAMLLATGTVGWIMARSNPALAMPVLLVGIFATLGLAIAIRFKPQLAAPLGSAYALVEGLLLGSISSLFEAKYQGIVLLAVVLTFGILGLMLMLYRARILQATPKFTKIVVAATGAIMLAYLLNFVLRLFGVQDALGLWGNGLLVIGISLVIIVVAAMNFILDFDMIEKGVQQNAPKYMEWYAAFGLMVTVIWLYLEILRLLAKLQRR